MEGWVATLAWFALCLACAAALSHLAAWWQDRCSDCGRHIDWTSVVPAPAPATATGTKSKFEYEEDDDDFVCEWVRRPMTRTYACPGCATVNVQPSGLGDWERQGDRFLVDDCLHCGGEGDIPIRRRRGGAPKFYIDCTPCAGQGWIRC